MISIESPVEGIVIQRDLQEDRWRLLVEGRAFELRPWSWGERRRLIECATLGSVFDREIFLAGLMDLLVEPRPKLDDMSGLALTCLYLLGVAGEEFPTALDRAEYLVIKTFGWRPSELDAQPAAAVDRLVKQVELSEVATRVPTDTGWTRIVIADEPTQTATPPAPVEARLDAAFSKLARAVGSSIEARAPASRKIPATPAVESRTETSAKPVTANEVIRPAQAAWEAGSSELRRPARSFETTLPGVARIRRPAPDTPAVRTREAREWSNVESKVHPHAVPSQAISYSRDARQPISGEPAPVGRRLPSVPGVEDVPVVRVNVEWPAPGRDQKRAIFSAEEAEARGPESPAVGAQLLENPFTASELEEQLADVLERGAREAGVDLP